MKQQSFEKKYAAVWHEFERLLQMQAKTRRNNQSSITKPLQNFPTQYRQICSLYALAKQRAYSPYLVNHLHALVLDGHQHLYKSNSLFLWRLLEFIGQTFPRTVRKHAGFFWTAALSFYGAAFIIGYLCYQQEELIYSIMTDTQVADVEYMYDPQNEKIGRNANRQAHTDFMMLGYYIFNNTSIGFRAFAGGLLFGIGTLFILLFNGIFIGGIAGHLSRLGFYDTFWPFVSGHSAFELTAIVISGMAGLLLAKPLFAPGPYRRSEALRRYSKDCISLIMGAALLFFAAAFIEAFWSPRLLNAEIKYGMSAILWLCTFWYLTFAGRKQRRGD